jgi:hypothetical protein
MIGNGFLYLIRSVLGVTVFEEQSILKFVFIRLLKFVVALVFRLHL